jgi:hypothetical protein
MFAARYRPPSVSEKAEKRGTSRNGSTDDAIFLCPDAPDIALFFSEFSGFFSFIIATEATISWISLRLGWNESGLDFSRSL